jgi:hypothetical protein
MMRNRIKQTASLPILIDSAEKAAKELKLQTRLLRKYAQKIGK